MRPYILTLLLALLAVNALVAQEDRRAEARKLAAEGVRKGDAGDFTGALALLEKAVRLDPDQPGYRYEQAYVHYTKGDYRRAVEIVESIITSPGAIDRWYQLLANSYDNLGDSTRAFEIYERGLKLFPNSGELHLELGVMSAKRKDYEAALRYWEEGIERDPAFPSNYYWAAKMYGGGANRIWSLLYGEIFMNLESNSQRTREISALLLETYRRSIRRSGDTVHVDVGKPVMVAPKKGEKPRLPLIIAYTTDLTMATMGPLARKDDSVVTVRHLNAIRTSFIEQWRKQKHDVEYPIVLFDRHAELIAAGEFEAYNYWLFSAGTEESRQWARSHGEAFASFGRWLAAHPMRLDSSNAVSRIRLEGR